MSNLFPKYKKSHTLQTALLVKGNSFSFHFPLMSPTAQSLKPTLRKPPPREPTGVLLWAVCKRDPSSHHQSGEYQGNPSRFTKVTPTNLATCSRPARTLIKVTTLPLA